MTMQGLLEGVRGATWQRRMTRSRTTWMSRPDPDDPFNTAHCDGCGADTHCIRHRGVCVKHRDQIHRWSHSTECRCDSER